MDDSVPPMNIRIPTPYRITVKYNDIVIEKF